MLPSLDSIVNEAFLCAFAEYITKKGRILK